MKIKFRGLHRNPETGESRYVYGYFAVLDGCSHIIEDKGRLSGNTFYLVDTKSVSQLVGYDKNGDEVYEGDVIFFDIEDPQDHTKTLHYEYTAHMKGFATAKNGCYITCEMFKEKELKK